MGLQFIFCIETNKTCNSDYIYISDTIKEYYKLDSSVKISRVYMNGKGNYCDSSVEKVRDKYIKEYAVGSPTGRSVVIYCFDCDDYDVKIEDKTFIKNAQDYCKRNGFRYVWFCKEIESVYLGKRVEDSQKKNEADRFARKQKIKQIDIQMLHATTFQDKRSNLCTILDEYIQPKYL